MIFGPAPIRILPTGLIAIQQSAINAATHLSFVNKPDGNRYHVYEQAAVISRPNSILFLQSEFHYNENGDLVPTHIPEQLIHTKSDKLSDDVWIAYWSQNKFVLRGSDLEVWKGRTMKMWSVLQDITIILDLDSADYLESWEDMCINLEFQLSPNLLFISRSPQME